MNAITGGNDGTVQVSGAFAPQVCPTYWGYTISEPSTAQKRGLMVELVSKIIGIGFLLATIGMWFLPSSQAGADVAVMKLGLMVLFMMMGAILVWNARKGFIQELQVDLVRRELRVGQRNLQGDYRLSTQLEFHEIGSVYLMRSKDKGAPARLYLRIGNTENALEVATGKEIELEPVRERLAHDLNGARERDGRTMSQQALRTPKIGLAAA
ncbi:hypothetical protein [Aliiroseovarius subalbicans]|uniref:hypothetical protein n=1 Tax=Aliiroseovarius subalbicans TaxID=2925840 RepID=UPI001F5675C2|nr:hypothetical protein [Aliiroseovarius subalbicans]MCI2398650.1 hypothetical protein [Aliiroseovarius subalbicans]